MVLFTNINFRDVGPGFGAEGREQLEADVKAGALGVGEIMQGLRPDDQRRPTARGCKLDDPELDPVWERPRG